MTRLKAKHLRTREKKDPENKLRNINQAGKKSTHIYSIAAGPIILPHFAFPYEFCLLTVLQTKSDTTEQT